MTRRHLSFLWGLVLTTLPCALAGQSTITLFRGARVFDGDRVISATDVLVRDGRIAAVGRNIAAVAGATVVDAAGMTLLPGLIDSHTHVFGDVLREALIFGVTTELDMFTDAGLARTLRAEQKNGQARARADVFSAGTLATAPGGHGTEYGLTIPTIAHVDSAQAFVNARIAEGSDWIKIVYADGGPSRPTIDLAVLRALVAAAHSRQRLAVVHIGTAAAAREAIEAGADGLVHLFTDTLPAADFAAFAKTRGAFVIPTLTVLKSVTGTAGSAGLANDQELAPYIVPSSAALLEQGFPRRPGAPTRSYDVAATTVVRLRNAGVPILAGTDAPNPGTAHGVAQHRELELLVQAGLSPTEALAAATSVPARAFRLRDRGRIAEGLRADLLLVRGDPTTDIKATRAIEGVWKEGVRADRQGYAAAIAKQRAEAGAPVEGLEAGLISDFESGRATTAFGTEWTLTTDAIANGKSTGEINVVDGGAGGSGRSLQVSGLISDAVPYAWSGAMWSPRSQPMEPADLSSKQGVVFQTKGDGRRARVLAFAQSRGMMPLEHAFTPTATWTEVFVPWSAFGIDGKGVMAVMFVGGPQPGAFAFQVDDVRLR